jgi:hypothetical protein
MTPNRPTIAPAQSCAMTAGRVGGTIAIRLSPSPMAGKPATTLSVTKTSTPRAAIAAPGHWPRRVRSIPRMAAKQSVKTGPREMSKATEKAEDVSKPMVKRGLKRADPLAPVTANNGRSGRLGPRTRRRRPSQASNRRTTMRKRQKT